MVYKEKVVQCFGGRETRQQFPSSSLYGMNDHIVNQGNQLFGLSTVGQEAGSLGLASANQLCLDAHDGFA